MKAFSELTAKERVIELLRWICVPVAAVLGSFVPFIIARWLIPPAMAQPPGLPAMPASDFPRNVLRWVLLILTGAAFVIAGAKTAPRCRPAAAILLAALWVLYSFLSHVAVHLGRGIPNYAHFIVAAAAAVGGAAFIIYSEKSRGRRLGEGLVYFLERRRYRLLPLDPSQSR